jgi:aspartate carbamoyltransferase catalytic subunit
MKQKAVFAQRSHQKDRMKGMIKANQKTEQYSAQNQVQERIKKKIRNLHPSDIRARLVDILANGSRGITSLSLFECLLLSDFSVISFPSFS